MEYELESPRIGRGQTGAEFENGTAYLFSREKPQELDMRTPVVTGAIRGTEFNITVADDGQTRLTVIDGEVELANAQGSVTIRSGEEAVTDPGRPPVKSAVLNAINVVQWNLYYPGVLDAAELSLDEHERQAVEESMAAYRAGDLPAALAKYPAEHRPASPAGHVFLGGLLLSVGLVEQSGAELKAAGTETENVKRLAGALRELVAAVKYQECQPGNPAELASEWLAESYYRQSRGQLADALAAARKAVEKSPAFGFGWERVAELEFSFGHAGQGP